MTEDRIKLSSRVRYKSNIVDNKGVGFFKTRANPSGWFLEKPSSFDVKFLNEQGYEKAFFKGDNLFQIFRSFSAIDESRTNLVMINLTTGYFAFSDANKLNEEDVLTFEPFSVFTNLLLHELPRVDFLSLLKPKEVTI